jgi:hypothetical protein
MTQTSGVPAPDAPWVMNLSQGMARRTGITVGWLLLQMPQWIHRRVESVSFLDDVTVRRRISVDFTIPGTTPPLTDRDGRRVDIAPIAMLRKERFPAFDFRDESNGAVPLQNAADDSRVVAEAIIYLAELRLKRQVEPALREEIRLIANAWPDEAEDLYRDLTRPRAPALLTRRLLVGDGVLRPLLLDAAKNFPILVLLEREVRRGATLLPRRRVLKLAYDEEIADARGVVRLLQSLSWRPRLAALQAAGIGDAASYHFDVVAPSDVEVVSAALAAPTEDAGVSRSVDESPRAVFRLAAMERRSYTCASVASAYYERPY